MGARYQRRAARRKLCAGRVGCWWQGNEGPYLRASTPLASPEAAKGLPNSLRAYICMQPASAPGRTRRGQFFTTGKRKMIVDEKISTTNKNVQLHGRCVCWYANWCNYELIKLSGKTVGIFLVPICIALSIEGRIFHFLLQRTLEVF